MALDDFIPKEEDKQKSMDIAYGYEEEKDKTWLQKFIEYLRQSKDRDKSRLQSMAT